MAPLGEAVLRQDLLARLDVLALLPLHVAERLPESRSQALAPRTLPGPVLFRCGSCSSLLSTHRCVCALQYTCARGNQTLSSCLAEGPGGYHRILATSRRDPLGHASLAISCDCGGQRKRDQSLRFPFERVGLCLLGVLFTTMQSSHSRMFVAWFTICAGRKRGVTLEVFADALTLGVEELGRCGA